MSEISRAELKYLVERQREEIRTLNEVGKLLSATTDPREILRLVSTYLHQAFPVAVCGVLWLEERKLHLIPLAPLAQMELARVIRGVREAAGEFFHRPLSEEESAPVIERVDGPATVGMPSTMALRSHLFAPMTVKGRPSGLLSLFSGREEAFTTEDSHAVGIVAEQLGAALRNAFLVEELRRAGELKNELLSIISHEFNTPLTAMREGVGLVLEGHVGDTTPEQQRLLKVVSENADRLEQLFHKVKLATELATGQAAFAFAAADVRVVLREVAQSHQALASAKAVELKLLEPAQPLLCAIDQPRLTIALDQLMDNALQATPRNGSVTLQGAPSSDGIEIHVIDTGAGMGAEVLPTLFEQFKSVGGIHNRKMGGLGLGLFIAHSLIQAHGGTLSVESALGKGTRMTARLPKQPPQSPSA